MHKLIKVFNLHKYLCSSLAIGQNAASYESLYCRNKETFCNKIIADKKSHENMYLSRL